MNMRPALIAGVCATFLALPLIGSAQKGPKEKAPDTITVGFGVTPPTTPILPNVGCAAAGIGGPADPCSYRLHHLTPEESTLAKGGELNLVVNGGGHAPAIYKVSKDTTRFDLGQFMCAGDDPEHIDNPLNHACDLVLAPASTPSVPGPGVANAAAAHLIKDGDGNVVITAAPAGPAGDPPLNLLWSPEGRLNSTRVGSAFVAADTRVTYRFLKTGRYLIICMNRSHSLNDWMFGFVNVVGDGDDNH